MNQMASSSKREELLTRQARLLPAQQALLEKRLLGKFKGVSQNLLAAQIEPVSRAADLPLSFREQRIFEIVSASTGDDLKLGQNMVRCFRLTGAFDRAAMEQAFNELVRRQEVLRTKFLIINAQPKRVIAPTVSPSLQVIELEHLPQALRLEAALKIFSEEAARPFNLIDSPLWRIVLLRLDSEDYLMLMVVDHFICDDWSMNLLVRDIWMFYRACSTGSPSALAELPVQFADFAHWQRQTLQGATLERLVSYWRRRLDGMGPIPELRLPIELPSPHLSGYKPSAATSLSLPLGLSNALKALCRERNVSLQVTMLSALLALMHLYTGDNDLGLRLAAAKRHRPEIKEVAGWFADRLVVRANVFGKDTFAELLQQVRDAVLEAYEHQDLPSMIFPGYDLNFAKDLFPPSLSFNLLAREAQRRGTQPPTEHSKAALNVKPLSVPHSGKPSLRKPGLGLVVTRNKGALHIFAKYEIERYCPSAIAELLANYRAVLESITANPLQRLAQIPISLESRLK